VHLKLSVVIYVCYILTTEEHLGKKMLNDSDEINQPVCLL
jgi:hypothetical protein